MDTLLELKSSKVAARVLTQLGMLYLPLAACAFIAAHAIAGFPQEGSPAVMILHGCGLLLIASSTFFDHVPRRFGVLVPTVGLVLYLCGTLPIIYRTRIESAWWARGVYLLPLIVGVWNVLRARRFPHQSQSEHAG